MIRQHRSIHSLELGEVFSNMRVPGVLRLVLLALLLQLDLSVPVAHGQTRTPTAAVVVQRMLKRYETITSYEDRGTVRVVPQRPSVAAHSRGRMPNLEDEFAVDFKTYYVRPDLFRFDWRRPATEQRESRIWSDGANFYSWMPEAGSGDSSFTLAKRGSLNVNLEASRGPSRGANYFIPTLLMKDAGYVSFADALSSMKRMSIVGQERVDGELCFRIEGLIMHEQFVLWIGKKSNLLRRIRTVYAAAGSFEDGKQRVREQVMAEETHYNIKINGSLDRKVFNARPVIRPGDLDLTASNPSPQSRPPKPAEH